MDRSLNNDVANLDALRDAASDLLRFGSQITAGRGSDHDSMQSVGDLLRDMARTGVLEALIEARSEGETARVKLLGQWPDGSMLSFYAMDDWVSPPQSEVHWHNYWQSQLVVSGVWTDSIWRPVSHVDGDVAQDVVLDRHERLTAGEVQVLAPDEPHGWTADERRLASGVVLLMWSGSAGGRPRINIDLASGRLSESYDVLNPRPESGRAQR